MIQDMDDQKRISRSDLSKLSSLSLPEPFAPPVRTWTEAEWQRILRGHHSRDMDDRWNAFVEDQRLFLHRSWTGHGIYEVAFERDAGGWHITEALVEGDAEIYRRLNPGNEAALLIGVINGVLLSEW